MMTFASFGLNPLGLRFLRKFDFLDVCLSEPPMIIGMLSIENNLLDARNLDVMPNADHRSIINVFTHTCSLVAVVALLSGCATLNQIIQKPTATFKSVKISHADLVQSTAVFDFDVNNPNPIGISASHITYDLKLNGRDFVNGRLDRGITLAAGRTNTLQIPITMPYLDIFDSAAQLWRTKKADYALSGGFDVGPFTIPFQAQGRFDLPKLPVIKLEAIQIQKFSLLGATLNCRLQMDNPNAFDFLFKRLDYSLTLAGKSFIQASALPRGPIGKHSHAPVNLTFDVSFAQLGRSAYQLLKGANADYTLVGGLIVDRPNGGEYKIPLNLSGKVPLER
jgi:LEA14-like dessication related protein